MLYLFIKIITSSFIIVAISEISKKSTFFGGIIASIPLISLLSIIWLYIDTKDINNIVDLSNSIFFMVIPSLVFFVSLPILLKSGINFYLSISLSIFFTSLCYGLVIFILHQFGIKI